MRPDKCGELGEPIKSPFDPVDIREPIRKTNQTARYVLLSKGASRSP